MDPQNQPPKPVSQPVPHAELQHDQAVSLRQPPVMSSQPGLPASEAPSPSFQPPVQSAAQTPTPNPVTTDNPRPLDGPDLPQQYYGEPEPAYDVDLLPPDQQIRWTASEFIDHPKTMKWYLVLIAISLILLVLAFFITHGDIITMIILAITFGLFGYMASRRPRQLSYALGKDGLSVGMKLYRYADFRAFSIFQEGHFASINFLPIKRFAPALSIYFDPDNLDQIGELLSQHLPYANHQPTAVDNLMHRIRF